MDIQDSSLALIPARAGSKGIPLKNIMDLCGRPLLAYTILAAQQSKSIRHIAVSSDSEEILAIARAWGATILITRPEALAGDHIQDRPVYQHAVRVLEDERDMRVSSLVVLRPTTPFRTAQQIDEAVRTFRSHQADMLKCVVKTPAHPHKMWTHEGGMWHPFSENHLWRHQGADVPRQELPSVYWQRGNVDILNRKAIDCQKDFHQLKYVGWEVDPLTAMDLDHMRDVHFAEYLIQNNMVTLPQEQVSVEHA